MNGLRLSHLTELAQAQLSLPLHDRLTAVLSDRFVYHERLGLIMREAEGLMRAPRNLRPRGLMLSGDCGSGKTTIADRLRRLFPSPESCAGAVPTVPVLYISLVNAEDAQQIYLRILKALGAGYTGHIRADARREMALDLIRVAGVQLLVVDEVQDLLMFTVRQGQRALTTLKEIMNSQSLPAVFLGTPGAESVLSRDSHMVARFTKRVLPSWSADDYLANFLDAFASSLPLAKPSQLSSLRMMRLILRECGPTTGEITRRVQQAAALAVEYGIEQITEELIRRAEYEPLQYALRVPA